jgi:hypothetical protein
MVRKLGEFSKFLVFNSGTNSLGNRSIFCFLLTVVFFGTDFCIFLTSVVGLNASNLDIKRGILHTRISWQLTHQSLPMRLTPWRQTAGSAPRSPRLAYFTVQSIKRLYMQRNNLEAQLEPSGHPTSPPYQLISMSHGMSSVLLSVHITYLWVCSASS